MNEMNQAGLLVIRSFFEERVKLVRFPQFAHGCGTLVAFEPAQLPFPLCRAFLVEGVPAGVSRGEHAHREAHQLLLAVAGQIEVELVYAGEEKYVTLSSSGEGLLIAPRVWSRQTYSGPEAKLLVFASQPYDAGSYIFERPE